MPDGIDRGAAVERLRVAGAAILDGVERRLPDYLHRRARAVADAWTQRGGTVDADLDDQLRVAADAATQRVGAELRALFDLDPAAQSVTPLQIVRSGVGEPTAVLQSAGISPVVRDAFDERSLPDDAYGLAPRTLGDLGDETLAPLHLAWGVAKAATLRSGASPP